MSGRRVSMYPSELGEEQPLWKLMLSHHPPVMFDRCYRIGSVHVCSRCLGIYPALALGILASSLLPSPPEWVEWLLLLGLPVPALLDWAAYWVWSVPGTNTRRTFTGALLGLAAARNLYLHWQDPFCTKVVVQAALVAVAAIGLWFLGYKRRSRLSTADLLSLEVDDGSKSKEGGDTG